MQQYCKKTCKNSKIIPKNPTQSKKSHHLSSYTQQFRCSDNHFDASLNAPYIPFTRSVQPNLRRCYCPHHAIHKPRSIDQNNWSSELYYNPLSLSQTMRRVDKLSVALCHSHRGPRYGAQQCTNTHTLALIVFTRANSRLHHSLPE